MPDYICYSRKDQHFVETLIEDLLQAGKNLDFAAPKDIPNESLELGDDIKNQILSADNFLSVITLNAITSPHCHLEISHARQSQKRIVTILYSEDNDIKNYLQKINDAIDTIPSNLRPLARQNWMSLSQCQHVIFRPTTDFQQSAHILINELDLDLSWIKLHNRIHQAAMLWEENNRTDNYLWSDEELAPIHQLIKQGRYSISRLEAEFIRPEFERLLSKLNDVRVTHNERAEIGNRLDELGDKRTGVGLLSNGVPDIAWSLPIEVPDENSLIKSPFQVAIYPITFAQFQAFIDDPHGFWNPFWWAELGNDPMGYMNQQQPGNQRYTGNNNPREMVSWYDAVAFSNWLSGRLGYLVRLPTEVEWEFAATGGKASRKYPWGSKFISAYCNTMETGLGRAISVGMYPQGIAECGAMDISGNVYEWTLSNYQTEDKTDPKTRKVMRGGSWFDDRSKALTTSRFYGMPFTRYSYAGFRLIRLAK